MAQNVKHKQCFIGVTDMWPCHVNFHKLLGSLYIIMKAKHC